MWTVSRAPSYLGSRLIVHGFADVLLDTNLVLIRYDRKRLHRFEDDGAMRALASWDRQLDGKSLMASMVQQGLIG